jgi:hypothetical protein
MTTLFDLVLRTARQLDVVVEGTATGGSTTTIVDTVARTEADDYWNGGTALIIYDAGGENAAPQGEYRIISDFANSTKTVTVSPAFSAAPATGDRYGLIKKRYRLNKFEQAINEAVSEIGPILIVDKTTLTTADNQTEYSLPLADMDLRRVLIQTQNDDADDNQWAEVFNWEVEAAATGTADILRLPALYPAGYKLLLEYVARHPALLAAADKLSESIHPDRVVYNAAAKLLTDYADRTGRQQDFANTISRIRESAAQADRAYPVRLPSRPGKIFVSRTSTTDLSGPDKVYL